MPGPLSNAVERLLQIDKLERLYAQAQVGGLTASLLSELQITTEISPGDLPKVPSSGPVVAVSNHPHGILDGIVLAELLRKLRPDTRILTNAFLENLPELAQISFFIDPFGRVQSRVPNGRALRQAISHLRSGGMLLIFPAGEVSHFDMRKRAICDPEWTTTAVRLIRRTNSKALPLCITGANSLSFQMLGMVHPLLRTAALPAELLNKRGKAVDVRIGTPVDASRIQRIANDEAATAFLRLRSELLAKRPARAEDIIAVNTPISEPVARDVLRQEVENLPQSCLLHEAREWQVYLARAAQIPHALQEIGRLREISFRAAGEGTGGPLDLDEYDGHYLHLFLWHRAPGEIVGAYRVAEIPHVLARHGAKGLYTRSLFRFQPGFFHRLGHALELGRSFVRPEYQRQFTPLLLLWKGIGEFIARNPEYRILIGPVSVSNQYSPASRELIATYFARQTVLKRWFAPVRPRRRLRRRSVQKWEWEAACELFRDVEDLSIPISDIEGDGKGLPILVKQYVKLGGKLLAFSVDPQFGNTLDGFVFLDLTRTSPDTLGRYMGKEQAHRFLAWHSETADTARHSVSMSA